MVSFFFYLYIRNRSKPTLMKYNYLFLILIVLVSCQSTPEVEWVTTTNEAVWSISSTEIQSSSPEQFSDVIQIDPSQTLQIIDGFGGCFNELGWEALKQVTASEKAQIMADLFDPSEGCNFNICRMPIGANDYAVDWYSYNEVAGDYAMAHFSIDRDRQRLIPYIKTAKLIQPKLKVWASPWCPPSWMKTNNHYACRADQEVNDLSEDKQGQEMEDQFITDQQTFSAYALYLSKFVEAYQKAGIDLYAIHVQNEPNSCQNFPSCVWTPQSLATFIGQYLGPQFEQDHPNTEIWLGTIERPQAERVDTVLQNKDAKKYLTGVGFQWAGKGVIPHVHKNYPEMKLMQTETECGDGSNDWKAMEHTFSLMKHYFKNGANAYMYWNMVLDNTGKSQWGWKQNSMVTITKDHRVVYNPEFYLMKHFSSFIEPGAKYIQPQTDENCLAFQNPDGNLIVIYYNEKPESVTKSFQIGNKKLQVDFTAKSLHTFKIKI